GTLYYVLPYVRGESLLQRLAAEQQLPVDEAVRIACQVAGALDYAHRHGVIHRDIKPENIMLHEGEAMVTDFGIALAVREAAGEVEAAVLQALGKVPADRFPTGDAFAAALREGMTRSGARPVAAEPGRRRRLALAGRWLVALTVAAGVVLALVRTKRESETSR